MRQRFRTKSSVGRGQRGRAALFACLLAASIGVAYAKDDSQPADNSNSNSANHTGSPTDPSSNPGNNTNSNSNNSNGNNNGNSDHADSTKVSDSATVFENSGEAAASVDANGDVVIPDSVAVTVAIKDASPENVGIKPPKNKKVTFSNQKSSVSVTDLDGGALLVTRKVNGKTLVEVASGTVRVEANDDAAAIPVARRADLSVATLLPKKGGVLPKVVVRRGATGSAAFVESGESQYRSVGAAAGTAALGSGSVFAGETANFNAAGDLAQVRLGSLDGNLGLPGDPLATLTKLDAGVIVPQLQGQVARLGGASLLDSIRSQLDAAFAAKSASTISFDPASGVVRYRLQGSESRFTPLGSPLVAATAFAVGAFTATSASQVASGSFTLIDRGVQLTLASTLGYFDDFNAAIHVSDPAGKVVLKSSGALWIDLLGNQYVVQPGALAEDVGITGQPALLPNADGLLAFRDSQGSQQTLFPTLADPATLQTTMRGADPSATVQPAGNGVATAGFSHGNYTLRPQYQLIPVPAGHAQDRWWLDGGTVYYTLPSGKVQGFAVR